MIYNKAVKLRNGKECILRNAELSDAEAFQEYFTLAHSETDFLTTYPDESKRNLEQTAEWLKVTKESDSDIEICAFVDGRLVGSAGNSIIHNREKTRHRAEFGISIIKEFWGLGIGSILTRECIECAKKAGFLQLELEVVAENENAIKLYQKYGFVEFGRNPRGFKTREEKWQELVLMRLELC